MKPKYYLFILFFRKNIHGFQIVYRSKKQWKRFLNLYLMIFIHGFIQQITLNIP